MAHTRTSAWGIAGRRAACRHGQSLMVLRVVCAIACLGASTREVVAAGDAAAISEPISEDASELALSQTEEENGRWEDAALRMGGARPGKLDGDGSSPPGGSPASVAHGGGGGGGRGAASDAALAAHESNSANGTRTLVIVYGTLRGGEPTWRSLASMLDFYDAVMAEVQVEHISS